AVAESARVAATRDRSMAPSSQERASAVRDGLGGRERAWGREVPRRRGMPQNEVHMVRERTSGRARPAASASRAERADRTATEPERRSARDVGPGPGSPVGRGERRAALLLAAGALLVGNLFIYGQAAGFGFVNYDDEKYVTKNAVVASGLNAESLAWG